MKPSNLQRLALCSALVAASVAILPDVALAAPYASGVTVSASSVSFVLNETADVVFVRLGNGTTLTLDGTTKGTKTFAIPSATTPFSIYTRKTDATGYTVPTGSTVTTAANGIGGPAGTTHNAGGLNVVNSDLNPLYRFNSPRGLTVNNNANSPFFGTTYVSNSAPSTAAIAAGTLGGVATAARDSVGDGLFALHADGTDAFGYGNTGQTTGPWSTTPSASAPWKLATDGAGNVYASDFSDATGNVYRFSGNLTGGTNLLATIGGPANSSELGQNHGSTTGIKVTGSAATGDLTVYTTDEDLTYTPSSTNKFNIWKYSFGSDAGDNSAIVPTRVNANSILLNGTNGLDISTAGNIYVTQNRSAGAEPGLQILNPAGARIYDSLSATRALFPDLTPAASDILANIFGMAISPDQSRIAFLTNNNTVLVMPLLADGTPDLANRVAVLTGSLTISGRDITFDAANNLVYISSSQQTLRVLSPGGFQQSLLSYNGTAFAFSTKLSGDYNNDGFVDAADYTVWADAFGQAGAGLAADGNSDGVIDAADYTIWADNFGQGYSAPAALSSVPEPTALSLVGVAALGLVRRRR